MFESNWLSFWWNVYLHWTPNVRTLCYSKHVCITLYARSFPSGQCQSEYPTKTNIIKCVIKYFADDDEKQARCVFELTPNSGLRGRLGSALHCVSESTFRRETHDHAMLFSKTSKEFSSELKDVENNNN